MSEDKYGVPDIEPDMEPLKKVYTESDEHPGEYKPKAYQPNRYAGLIFRLIASIIDNIIGSVLIICIMWPLSLLVTGLVEPHSLSSGTSTALAAVIVLPALIAVWLYYAGFESSRHMATPGKMVCGLKVTNGNFQQITFGQATIRFIAKNIYGVARLVPNSICTCLAGLCALGDVLAMYTNEERQCVHDMIADTVVIHA